MISILNNNLELQKTLTNWIGENYDEKLLENQRVFIKPNMGYPKPAPFTTSIDIIVSTIEILSNAHAEEIIIAEGSTSKSSAIDNFQITGLVEALKEYDISYIDIDTYENSEVVLNTGVKHYLPKYLQQMDLRISMPVIKFYDDDEGNTFLSNAIKNFFGLPQKKLYKMNEDSHRRDKLHKDLHKSVAEVFQAVQQFAPFDLYICDGINILKGEAEHGEAMKWGKILFSDDAINVDLKVLEIMKKKQPRYLKYLLENKK
ncbi:MAG: DUF362 domain-containing protein [Candidatus Heimdallarchaeota archaeon]